MALPEALDRLAAMPAMLLDVTARASVASLAVRGPGGTFSLAEHACHLRDLEREGYRVRLERMLAEERPELEDFDGAAIAAARDYASQDGRAAAREFAAERARLVARLASLPPEAFARGALFGGRAIMLCDLVAMIVEHDRGHRDEIEALAKEAGAWR